MNSETQNSPKTLTVAEAGARYFGLCRASSYAAVKRGEIPVIRIGNLLRVPVVAMERMMEQAGARKDTVG
jgi:excisionase family DNA binding protein